MMKKHHLLLLIICLLLVASLAFPYGNTQNFAKDPVVQANIADAKRTEQIVMRIPINPNSNPSAELTTHADRPDLTSPAEYYINDLNELPNQIVEGDTVYIKQIMNELSVNECTEIEGIKMLMKQPNGTVAITSLPLTNHLVQMHDQLYPHTYLQIPPLAVGKTHTLQIVHTRTYTPNVKECNKCQNHELTIVPKTDKAKVLQIREGDDE